MSTETTAKKPFPWAVVVGALLGAVIGGYIIWDDGSVRELPLLKAVPPLAFLIACSIALIGWRNRTRRRS